MSGKRVPATIVDDIDDHPDLPGAVEMRTLDDEGRPCGMAFRCPCGCGRESWLPFEPHGRPGPSWEWDGNETAPTLKPSILFKGGCRWHGYLTDGVFKEC